VPRQSKATDPGNKAAGEWRPTGSLTRRLSKLIIGTALFATLFGIVLSAVSLTVEYRARMLNEVSAAIVEQYELLEVALNGGIESVGTAAARNIAEDTHASTVLLFARDGREITGNSDAAPAGVLARLLALQLGITQEVSVNGDTVGEVEVVVSARPVLQALLRFLVVSLIGLAIVTTMSLLIVRRMRRDVTAPIGRLLEKMDTVARTKNFEVQAPLEGPDEIGSLAISFNSLLQLIHSRNQALAKHRQQLQELVIERTRNFEKAANEAEIASRAKGDFLARMSHEIRTPMNGVIGMAELLEDTKLEDKQHHMLNTMRSSADALLEIINDILDFSRIEAGQLQVLKTAFSPVDLIEEICELLAPRAHERDLELVCDIDLKVPEGCTGDPLRLRQIITNLVGNAIKYTQKGSVTLRASAIPRTEGGITLRVEVEDTGFGISEDQLQKMFEPFTQGDSFETRKQGGTGLGLAITKQLVSLLGGEVNVTSKLGAGSKFWITIPLQVEKAPKEAPPQWQSGIKRALVVQNDVAGARVAARQLERSGSEVTLVRGGREALDALLVEEFELIVVDELLPDMNGYEFIDRLRGSGKAKSLAIVMLTTTRPGATGLARASDPDAHVAKPVRRVRLREAIDRALGRGGAAEADKQAAKAELRLDMKVLLVEDSPVNREVARGMLESLGCSVETASDGSIGVEMALSWKFDAVLMDCQMPLMDGFEATSRIRKAETANGRDGMPIIALTANALQGDRERCLAAGMSDFISKPFTMKKLHAALLAARTGKPTFELAPAEPQAAPQQQQKAAPVLDMKHIDEVRSLGKPGLLEDALALFQKQASAALEETDQALQTGTATDLVAHFHALKSCSLSLGAKRFAALAGDCEEAARKGDLDAAGRLAVQLRPEYAILCDALAGIPRDVKQAV
jgi:signal transduction histidine kinase/CheY-like chemotaxis protein